MNDEQPDPTPDEVRHRAYELFLARGAIPGNAVDDWLRAERELRAVRKPGCDRERWRFVNTFAPWFSALASTAAVVTALVVASRAADISLHARADAYEPRVVVSAFAPWRFGDAIDPMTGGRKTTIKSGRLSLKNIGKGEAVNVACHIVNPFSSTKGHQYAYHRFRSESFDMLLCDGETIEEGFKRARQYNRVLAPDEDQQFCVHDLDMDPTIFESFLVVQCTYTDKERTPKGGDQQEVELPSGFGYSNKEMDVPAQKLFDQYQRDPRVLRFREAIQERTTPTDSSAPTPAA